MAFRFQSAVAGFATRASERLKTLEEDTKEIAKTEAGRIAQEIAEARKQRIKDTLDYNTTARKLKSAYGLSDAQVYTVLQGGLEEADAFMNTVRAGAIEAKTNNKEFNAADYAQNLFTVKDYEGMTIPGIEQQAAGYAAMRSPISAQSLVDQAAQTAGVNTKTLLGQANPEYLKSLINQQVSASAGQLPSYEGPAFGTGLPEGAGFTRATVTPEDMLAIQKGQAEVESIQVGTQLKEAQIKTEDMLRDLNADQIRATIENTTAGAENQRARTNRINAILGLEKEKMRADIDLTVGNLDKLNKSMDVMDAQIAQMQSQTNKTDAEIGLVTAKVDDMLLSISMKQIDLENYPDMAKAILAKAQAEVDYTKERANELAIKNEALPDTIKLQQDEILANIFLKESQAEVAQLNGQKLADEIILNQQFGEEERQAALDLTLAKIIDTENPSDFEEYQTGLMVANDKLRAQLRETTDPVMQENIQAQIDSNTTRILDAHRMSGSSSTSSIWSKVNPQTTFNSMLANAGASLDLELQFDSVGNVIKSKFEGSRLPVYFQATSMAIQQMQGEFGFAATGSLRGEQKVVAESIKLNQAIGTYAQRNIQRATVGVDAEGLTKETQAQLEAGKQAESQSMGTHRDLLSRDALTAEEAGKLAMSLEGVKNGDTAEYISKLSGETIYMVYQSGGWIFADADYSQIGKDTLE